MTRIVVIPATERSPRSSRRSHEDRPDGYVSTVQTFLPYPDFRRSAQALDQRRLGKQRVEALQVLRALTWPRYGWRHHPAVKMWAGYEEALVRYGLTICGVWCATGRADTCAVTLTVDLAAACQISDVRSEAELAAAGDLPPWLGHDDLHRSHRAALLRKDPDFYGPIFGEAPSDLPYVWPASDREPRCRMPAAPDHRVG